MNEPRDVWEAIPAWAYGLMFLALLLVGGMIEHV